MVTKFGMGDEVGNPYPCAKFHYDPIRCFCFPLRPARAVAYKARLENQGFLEKVLGFYLFIYFLEEFLGFRFF